MKKIRKTSKTSQLNKNNQNKKITSYFPCLSPLSFTNTSDTKPSSLPSTSARSEKENPENITTPETAPFIVFDDTLENLLTEILGDKIPTCYPQETQETITSFTHKKRKRVWKGVSPFYKKRKQPKVNPFKFINYKQQKQGSPPEVSVLSYNILNQLYMKKKETRFLTESHRLNKICQEIKEWDPDVFCWQEADLNVFKNYIQVYFKTDYCWYYGTNCGSSFINVIGFKEDKFGYKCFKNFSLGSLGKLAGNRGIMNIQLELNQNRNVKYYEEGACQGENVEKKLVSIYNVHFPWKYETDRIKMLNMIYEHIEQNAENWNVDNEATLNRNNIYIFIIGDFNSEPQSDIIKQFYNKHNKQTDICNPSFVNSLRQSEDIFQKYKFQSAYQCYLKKRVKGGFMRFPEFTTRTQFYKKTIDYMFFSKNLRVTKILKLPEDKEVNKEKFLPSSKFPSDHLKLFGKFDLI